MPLAISRRTFAGTLGLAAGAALFKTPLARTAEAAARAPRPADAILLNSNENPYGPSPKALEAFAKAGRVANRYPDALENQMRNAIATHHGVTPDQVVLGCGSSEILQMADLAFSGPSLRVVAAEPTFEAVLLYAKAIRADGVKVPLTPDFRHDLPKMAEAAAKGAGLVYVCNPNNPTATIVTGDELAAFVAVVPPSTTILVDEAYHHFVEDPRYRSALEYVGKAPNVVVVRTFSKIYGMAGLRLGYAVGSVEKIAGMAKFASFSNANAAVLAAALASLADPDLVPRQRKVMNDARRWLVAEMAKQGRRTIPSETNFVMIDVEGDVKPVI
jgi:histidinol-phosphate aminotransferase